LKIDATIYEIDAHFRHNYLNQKTTNYKGTQQKMAQTKRLSHFQFTGAVGLEPTARGFGGRVKLKRPSKLFPLLSRL